MGVENTAHARCEKPFRTFLHRRFAGLDVFASEPNVPEALLAMDNVVLQPHQGSATNRTRRAMGDLVVDNLAAHFADKPALTPVG